MAQRFHYSAETCRYEPIVVSPKAFVKSIFRFLSISFLIGLLGLLYYNTQYPLLDEVNSLAENKKLNTEWQVIHAQLKKTSQHLTNLENNDDKNLRIILGLEPLSVAQREAGVGGREKASAEVEYPVIRFALDLSGKINNRLTVEVQSMKELKKTLLDKQKEWASRPAIQPIDNKNLTHLYLVFGERLHPILGYSRPHNGLDFAAPYRSPIYATGDGVVTLANGGTTYGNVVFINHGYRFETRYAHMSRFIVKVGDVVKRGQVIGYVGNTGLSGGTHLHYEVLHKDSFINPIYFFQRDLNSLEFEKLIKQGNATTSLD